MHEQDDRERAPSAFRQAEIADERELTGLEGDLLDPGLQGLAGRLPIQRPDGLGG
jgi:hypothetical protein